MHSAARTHAERNVAPRPCRWRSVVPLGVLLLVVQAAIGSAQTVRGVVIDGATQQPVPGAILTVHGADSAVVASAVSDALGRWSIRTPGRGEYVFVARRLGYRPFVSAPINVPVRDDAATVLRLEPLPTRLDPIEARAAAIKRSLELNGFYERQKGNFGHFVTPEAIERRQAARVTDLLTTIPGVQLYQGGSGSVGPAHIAMRGSNPTGSAMCRPRVFVDGLLYSRGDSRPIRASEAQATEQAGLEEAMDRALSVDDIGHPSTIAGIEVYRSATQVPVQFGGSSQETLCGVIVIWTQSGEARGRP